MNKINIKTRNNILFRELNRMQKEIEELERLLINAKASKDHLCSEIYTKYNLDSNKDYEYDTDTGIISEYVDEKIKIHQLDSISDLIRRS
jgi:hypothetical protein